MCAKVIQRLLYSVECCKFRAVASTMIIMNIAIIIPLLRARERERERESGPNLLIVIYS